MSLYSSARANQLEMVASYAAVRANTFAAVGEAKVVAVGDLAHELVRARNLGGAHQLLVIHAGAFQRDVLAHRAGQQHALLHDQRGAAAEPAHVQFGLRDAVGRRVVGPIREGEPLTDVRLLDDALLANVTEQGRVLATALAAMPDAERCAWLDLEEILTADEIEQYDPSGLAFWNVNTPEEFSKAEKIAQT